MFLVRHEQLNTPLNKSIFEKNVSAGYADYSIQEPYRENTLTTLFSSTKGVSALCVAMLVDRSALSTDTLS